MSARFSGSVETGRRWGGRPEQARVWIDNTLSRTLLLGFDKANLVSTGRATATGSLRPGRFLASVKPFFYDLADSGHLAALKVTWHHLAAYAAGFKQHPRNPAYKLALGQDRELCRTEYSPGRYEVLVASCYNQNYRETDDAQLFAWDPGIRRRAWEDHYRRFPVVQGYRFQIYRVDRDGYRVREFQRGADYEVPFAAVESLVQQAERVLRELWQYIQRNPSQVYTRHDAFPDDEWIVRWQLFDPPAFNNFIGPDHRYAFAFAPDHDLFGAKVATPVAEVPSPPRPTQVHPLETIQTRATPQTRVQEGSPAARPCTPRTGVGYWLIWLLQRFIRLLLACGTALLSRPQSFPIKFFSAVERPVDSHDEPEPVARGPPCLSIPGPTSRGGFYFFDRA